MEYLAPQVGQLLLLQVKKWYVEYGISFHEAIISANIPELAYRQGVYSLHEANETNDYEYVLDITADTIEFLYEKSNIERKQKLE